MADSGDGASNIHYGDILVKFGECINIATASLPIITNESVINKYRSSFLKNGDIVIADTAEDETVGKCAEIIEEKGETIISGLHTIPCRPTCDFAGGFLGYYMNSSSFHDQLSPLMQGIKVTSISKSALQTTMVQYPQEKEEQAQIGRMFQNLDRLITLHQRVQCVTSLLMSWEFDRFTIFWEQRKIGDLCQRTTGGGTPRTGVSEYWNGEIPWFQSSDFKDGIVTLQASNKHISQEGLHNSAAQLIPGESIAIVARVGFGKLSLIPFQYTTSQDILSLSNLTIDPLYGVYTIYKKLQSELMSVQGTSIKGVTKDDLLAKDISVSPNDAEQQKIGLFFHNLDDLITLHQREFSHTKLNINYVKYYQRIRPLLYILCSVDKSV